MNEQLSGWLDGEWDGPAAERLLRDIKDDPAVFDDLQMTFLVGDALRGEMALGTSFMARFADTLKAEPTIVASGAPLSAPKPEHIHKRFVALSAVASVAAFMVVGWFAFNAGSMSVPAGSSAASAVALAPVANSRPADSAKMKELMAMHQELSSYQAVAFNTAGQ